MRKLDIAIFLNPGGVAGRKGDALQKKSLTDRSVTQRTLPQRNPFLL